MARTPKKPKPQPPVLTKAFTGADLQEAMKGVAMEAFGTVVDIMRLGENENNRLAASKMLIEYVAGKPRQDVGISGELKVVLTQEQRDAAMRAVMYGEG